MKTFVVFDRKTGEILQTHISAGHSLNDREDVLRMRADAERSVDVIEVDELAPGRAYKVDMKAGKLLPVEATKSKGSGGGSVRLADDLGSARTIFFDYRQEKR